MRKHHSFNKVLVIGSGPIVIGQAAEFDYAGTQACLALKEEGIEVVLVNNNPATIMTDKDIADHVYMEPLQVDTLEKVIAEEKPDGMIGTLGGQTGLNLTVELYEKGILDHYNVELLGTSVPSIQKGESRELFRNLMLEIDEPISDSKIIESVEEGIEFIQEIGYPVILRPAYTLGGEGGGFAYNDAEYVDFLNKGLSLSPINQVLVEKSIKGWKEIEYEVMRDANDTCVIVCNMENMDPVGVHTGDSIVTAPSQTLSDVQYQMLRTSSLKVIRALDVVGGCNIQFALNPESNEYCIIEVNPRVSRSSALASKATGYPIARIATKCAIGYPLDEILNPITGNTYASFEPALDYVVVKLPRFPFDKFTEADRTLGTQMKATGEVMAIDRTFEGALNKAIRSLEMNVYSLHWPGMNVYSQDKLTELLSTPNDLRLFAIAEAFTREMKLDDLIKLTAIDCWFLRKIQKIIQFEQSLLAYSWPHVPEEILKEAKQLNISDKRVAELVETTPRLLRTAYKERSIKPAYKLVDTCAGEFDAITPYYYSTWNGNDEVITNDERKKILVLGSGPIRIGQGVEFDYCSVHAALAVKKMGYDAVVINNNPETVSTDYTVADRLYFEPLALEDVLGVIEKENITGVLIQFGGQTAINLANDLEDEGIHVLGTKPAQIDQMEDREQFYEVLNQLNIPHIAGHIVHGTGELSSAATDLGFPVIIRPSYVIGGQSMFVCYNHNELEQYVKRIQKDTNDSCWPLLIDQYISGLECEIDVISDGKDIVIPGIFEHLEKAGVHSGDSITSFPPVSLAEQTKNTIVDYTRKISQTVPIIGMMNIQFVIQHETVYVLEVNPRSSRTVPIMSKVTDIPMIEWAVRTQLGTLLTEMTTDLALLPEPVYHTIKAPIFSASKLKDVDHALGPEMKSTGEIIGLGWNQKEALKKASPIIDYLEGPNQDRLQVFVSVSDRMKSESVAIITEFINLGANITATEGTAKYLEASGISTTSMLKDKDDLLRHWRNSAPHIVLNIPNQGREKEKIGFYIRELSVRYQIPYFTSLETLQAMTDWFRDETIEETPRSLQSYVQHLIKDVQAVR
ncbi:carbamoyl-phosphate synthase large subunit [Virgibacillus natechei]|uniref:Carbamoyl phosphate synthase large chain n=1 Tax=Virgibacillus natechei TaxID=1216297 RepID=A0ABS4IGR0_9BACI|nr:carbamoyl-phosphate synthase (glutamine-hydrolyzing) large subunit [Virgibacillus natechei]MBP1970132.1 carbamoyl-phosphate synthase large subunit [Virgibacillus natechei]UZD14206.1 carbamoyl-phosphate synthase (glutamine-hydrolyzing) large subunit [Virgibacillus natechei]